MPKQQYIPSAFMPPCRPLVLSSVRSRFENLQSAPNPLCERHVSCHPSSSRACAVCRSPPSDPLGHQRAALARMLRLVGRSSTEFLPGFRSNGGGACITSPSRPPRGMPPLRGLNRWWFHRDFVLDGIPPSPQPAGTSAGSLTIAVNGTTERIPARFLTLEDVL